MSASAPVVADSTGSQRRRRRHPGGAFDRSQALLFVSTHELALSSETTAHWVNSVPSERFREAVIQAGPRRHTH